MDVSLTVIFELIKTTSLGQWSRINDNCWQSCWTQGGRCSYCESNYNFLRGYCCRGDGTGGNGDCPQSAINLAPSDYHACVGLS